jgi:16S rRNA (uracil1498-N3)-methyltransferase
MAKDNSYWISVVPSDPPAHPGVVPPGLEFYYVPPERISTDEARIDGEEFAHLTHVMRHREGDTIGIVDGAGMAYVATIAGIANRVARCMLRSAHPELHEPTRQVTLAVGVLKNPSRFDVIVEKATELGVRTIIPMLTARTISHHAKTGRWQTIALAAMKQCGRCRLPVIASLTQFSTVVAHTEGTRLILHEQASAPLDAAFAVAGNTMMSVCIGPEGGFTAEEIIVAEQHGWRVVSAGERRMRSETAAIVAAVRLLL